MKRFVFLFFAILSFSGLYANELQWESPETLSTAMVDATDAQVVMDPSGNVTAAWIENDVVLTSELPFGGSWSTPISLSGSGASSHKLGVTSNGEVTALWEENGVITTAVKSLGIWGVSEVLSSTGASSPALAVNTDGVAVAVWERSGFIEAKTRTDQGTWELTATVLSGPSSDHPDVAIGNDKAVAVWHTVYMGADILLTASQQVGGSWNAPVGVVQVSTEFSVNYPKIALDADGNAALIAFFYQLSNGNYSNVCLYGSTMPYEGTTWTALPTKLSGNSIRSPEDLSHAIVFDNAGNALAFWSISYDHSHFSYESALKLKGQSWSETITLFDPELYCFSGDVSTTALGNAIAAFMFYDGDTISIQSAEATISGASEELFWSDQLEFSTESRNGYPKISAALLGNEVFAAAAWLGWDGVNTLLQVSIGTREVINGPTNLAVQQVAGDFGVFNDFCNIVTWLDSTSPDVVEYVIFRNGILSARVAPGDGQYVDHNVVQGQPTTYGIAAIDNSLSQSQIVYVNYP